MKADDIKRPGGVDRQTDEFNRRVLAVLKKQEEEIRRLKQTVSNLSRAK